MIKDRTHINSARRLIEPSGIELVHYDDLLRNYQDWVNAIFRGRILRISGHPGLDEFRHRFIEPALKSENYEIFRPNEPNLYRVQALQRALFTKWPVQNGLIDSVLRLRRTVGEGGFVGPHIDRFENLPEHAINCWIAFTPLAQGEAINFYPSHWHPGYYISNSGHFKPGVWRDGRGGLLPTKRLSAEALTSEIDAGEFFAFASGLMVHSSPFHVRCHRITADLRILPVRAPDSLFFQERRSFYRIEDMDAFREGRDPRAVLEELWRQYEERDLFDCRSSVARLLQSDQLEDVIDEGSVDPTFLLMALYTDRKSVPDHILDRFLDRHSLNSSLRVAIAREFSAQPASRRAAKELFAIPPEHELKTFSVAAKVIDTPTFLAVVRGGGGSKRRGIMRALVCFFVLKMFPDIGSGPIAAACYRLRLKASRLLHENLFPELYCNEA